jgi:hypothetical protein
MISTSLALLMDLSDSQVASIQSAALIHDMEEVWTGDLPSPYKESLKRTGGSPSWIGWDIGIPVAGLSDAPDPTPPVGPEIPFNTVVADVVRAADRIDAWQWSQKYVLDEFVKADCETRMMQFMNSHMWDAMETLISEI